MLSVYRATRSLRLFVFDNLLQRHCLSSAQPSKRQPRGGRPGRPSFLISNLNPSSLVETDKIDISDRQQFTVRFPNSTDELSTQRHEQSNPLCYEFNGHQRVPFPAETSGFLYYHQPPHALPSEGGIRFRLAHSPSRSSFASAPDLFCTNGAPWQITFPQLACRKYPTILNKLCREFRDVSALRIALCQRLFGDVKQISSHILVFRLTQEFPINFRKISLVVVGEDAIQHVAIPHLFQASQQGERWYPWAGSAIARFERSTDPQYAGRRVVHLRIVRIVGDEPVSAASNSDQDAARRKHNRVVKPEAGQLVRRLPCGLKVAKPWAYDIDEDPQSTVAVGLAMLWKRD
ncbi:hypothetical protein R3P38DRAFT_2986182, partial [Favolaschia claudopus]